MSDKHHYVPKFYLEGFVDRSNPSYVWVADVQQKLVRKESPRRAARISGYYNLEGSLAPNRTVFEEALAAVETRACQIIHRLRESNFHLTVEERYHLSTFIGLQIVRVPVFRQLVDDTLERAANARFRNYLENSDRFRDKTDEQAQDFKERFLAGRLKLTFQFKDDQHRRDSIIALTLKAGLDFAGLVFGMHWVFLQSKGKVTFFASDNPVRLMSPNAKPLKIDFTGKNENLEFSIAISPSCTLWMHAHGERANILSVDVDQVDAPTVRELNSRIMPTIHRYAFCSTERQAKTVLNRFT